MLRSLRNTVSQGSYNNGGGGGDSSATHFLQSLLLRNPFLLIRSRFISSSSSSFSSISISSSTNQTSSSSSSFVVSYLMNSCGLSEDKAISASKKIHFETSSKPDSVLTLLETHGFTKPYVSKLITRSPSLLTTDPDKTLKPKLEFFNSMGLSDLDLAILLSRDPTHLNRSLKNQIIPSFALLKNIVHTDRNVIAVLKRCSWVLQQDLSKNMLPNIQHLRDQGVPESNITKLLITQPRALLRDAVRFKEIVEEIKRMGFDPLKITFVLAIHGLTSMSKSTWEAKLDVYRRWGWTEDEILLAFKKQPFCMMASEKKVTAIMDFLVNQMGYNPSLMAKHPYILLYSLEKRIIPRCSVIRILVTKGLITKKCCITTVLQLVEESFLKKYVIKYEQKVPELLKVYQGQLDCLKLPKSGLRL